MNQPLVAYIIVCWNNRDLMEECITSINDQNYDNKKIIMVDNGSSDDSVEFVEKKFPEVEIIQTGHNNGFAKGNNIGITNAFTDKNVKYIALINSDATLDKNWTREIIDFASIHPRAALLQGLTLDYYDHKIVDSTHIFVDHNGVAVQANWRKPTDKLQTNFKKVMGVNAAAAIYTRKFLEEQPFNQAFDESLFMYLEDVDISLRATVTGWDNYFVKDAVAYHMGSVSSGKNPGYSLYMTFRNNIPVLYKNLPARVFWKLFLKMPKTDFTYMRELARRDQADQIWVVMKARFVSMFKVFKYIGKHRKMVKNTAIDEEYLKSLMHSGR